MDNKIKIVIVALIVLSLACTAAYTYQGSKNTTSDNLTLKDNITSDLNNNTAVEGTDKHIKDVDVEIIQKGPDKPVKKGTYATVTYTITNKGKQTIYNAEIQSQVLMKYIGTLKPGQTKKHVYKQYLALDSETELGPIPPVWDWGGVHLYFEDEHGKPHYVRSNQISIKVV